MLRALKVAGSLCVHPWNLEVLVMFFQMFKCGRVGGPHMWREILAK